MSNEARPVKRVLSLDGGGIRGIIPALVIAHLERQMGAPASELFDLIVGTSTGGILALALALQDEQGRPLLAAKRMVALYERHGGGGRAFPVVTNGGGLFEEAYSHGALETILQRCWGEKAERLGTCNCDELRYRALQNGFIKSWHSDHSELLCAEASRDLGGTTTLSPLMEWAEQAARWSTGAYLFTGRVGVC